MDQLFADKVSPRRFLSEAKRRGGLALGENTGSEGGLKYPVTGTVEKTGDSSL